MLKEYCDLLGVGFNCTLPNLKKAYKKALFKYHPDTSDQKKSNQEIFKKLPRAYQFIKNQINMGQKYFDFGKVDFIKKRFKQLKRKNQNQNPVITKEIFENRILEIKFSYYCIPNIFKINFTKEEHALKNITENLLIKQYEVIQIRNEKTSILKALRLKKNDKSIYSLWDLVLKEEDETLVKEGIRLVGGLKLVDCIDGLLIMYSKNFSYEINDLILNTLSACDKKIVDYVLEKICFKNELTGNTQKILKKQIV